MNNSYVTVQVESCENLSGNFLMSTVLFFSYVRRHKEDANALRFLSPIFFS